MSIRKVLRITFALLVGAVLVYVITGFFRSLFLESTSIKLRLPSKNGNTATVRIVQISDLHRAVFGNDNEQLVNLIASKAPDIIVATGDMIDVRTEGYDASVRLFDRLTSIAPVIYSLGNHEIERDDLSQYIAALRGVGVNVLNNNVMEMTVHGIELRIGGLYRAEFLRNLEYEGGVDILLCHFPDKIGFYTAYGVPLTFSGHTHGGQFRVPLLHIALYAPGQGLFPRYTAGLYEEYGCYMIVSRGLGNSSFPFRVHNPPEVVVADITFSKV